MLEQNRSSPLFLSVQLPLSTKTVDTNDDSLEMKIMDDIDVVDYVKVEPEELEERSSSPDIIEQAPGPSRLSTTMDPLKEQMHYSRKREREENNSEVQQCLKVIGSYFKNKIQEPPDYFGLYVGQKLRSLSPNTRRKKEKEIVILLNM